MNPNRCFKSIQFHWKVTASSSDQHLRQAFENYLAYEVVPRAGAMMWWIPTYRYFIDCDKNELVINYQTFGNYLAYEALPLANRPRPNPWQQSSVVLWCDEPRYFIAWDQHPRQAFGNYLAYEALPRANRPRPNPRQQSSVVLWCDEPQTDVLSQFTFSEETLWVPIGI